jgi:hypothetical protein
MRLREFAKLDEIKKGAKDSNGFSSCWTGYHAAGTKKGKNGGPVRNCVKNESLGANTHSSLEADLAKKYMELAPSIKKYKDEEGADHLYQELLAIARHHGAERKFIHMCNGARNSAHLDYDTNPGHFKNWFWYLGLGNEQGVAEAGPNAPYTPSPAKPFRNPRGFNKQGTGVGNKLADLNRKEWEEKKKKEQGVAEGSISDLLNKDPKSPKFNDHSAPRKTKHSGSTPTPYEQGRLDAHRKKSYNNIHNTEQDAEDYKTGYRHVKSRQGVAEGAPIVVMPSHKRLEKKHKPSLSRGMDPAKAQGEQDARDGKPYNNPYPFKKELGAPGNWEHNSYKASYDSVKPGVAESGAKQAAIAIAKKASGKYTKDGKRLKEGSRSS